MRTEVRAEIAALAEPAYRDFSQKLLPGCGGIQGVRLPALRRLARELARTGGWRDYLAEYFAEDGPGRWFEEDMLAGMCIGAAKLPAEEAVSLARRFRPWIGNWSVCDSFCTGFRAVSREREAFWPFVTECLETGEEYGVRLGAVLLLAHYRMPEEKLHPPAKRAENTFVEHGKAPVVDIAADQPPEWADRAVALLAEISHPGYYARMAAAWALSMFYLDFPEKVLPLLEGGALRPEVRRMTIRKICESRRPSPEEKARLRALGGGVS